MRAGGKQVTEERSRRNHLLEVIDHEQEPPLPQRQREAGLNQLRAGFAHSEHMGDRLHHQARVADRAKGDVAGLAGKVVGHGGRGRHSEPGLADSTGTSQGQQPIRSAQGCGQRRDLALSSDEGSERRRERTSNRKSVVWELIYERGVCLPRRSGAAASVGVLIGSSAGMGSTAPETVEVHGQNLENPSPFDGTQLTAGNGATDRPLVDAQACSRGPGRQED